jgi:hypothetical protein
VFPCHLGGRVYPEDPPSGKGMRLEAASGPLASAQVLLPDIAGYQESMVARIAAVAAAAAGSRAAAAAAAKDGGGEGEGGERRGLAAPNSALVRGGSWGLGRLGSGAVQQLQQQDSRGRGRRPAQSMLRRSSAPEPGSPRGLGEGAAPMNRQQELHPAPPLQQQQHHQSSGQQNGPGAPGGAPLPADCDQLPV